jgi:hypothetical protein
MSIVQIVVVIVLSAFAGSVAGSVQFANSVDARSVAEN